MSCAQQRTPEMAVAVAARPQRSWQMSTAISGPEAALPIDRLLGTLHMETGNSLHVPLQ